MITYIPVLASEKYTQIQTTGILCLPHLVFVGMNNVTIDKVFIGVI
jgi:hypothetical protein